MINIAELLKDCPKGTKLYSPLFGEVFLYTILSESKFITVRTAYSITTFNEFGQWGDNSRWERFPDAECLLFPSKEVRTWEGWKAPVEPKFKVEDWITDGTCKVKITAISNTYYWYAKNCILGEIESIDKEYHLWSIRDAKDGDVLVTDFFIFLFKKVDYGNGVHYYCHCGVHGEEFDIALSDSLMGRVGNTLVNYRPATKEQCDLLFAKMQEAGYEWDADKKELKKIKPHYNIANFYAGMPVLVRDYNNSQWSYVQFSHLIAERNVGEGGFKFNACGIPYIQCIPFNEETKHLLGTTDMCDEMYINW